LIHAFTVDVEEHFQVHGFERSVSPADWGAHESRVGRNVERVLELCRAHQVRGTFFVLGWCAERAGSWLAEIGAAGHEIASHGYAHQLLYRQGPERFAEDLRRSLEVLRERTGQPIAGYRAPSYSVTRRSLWAYEVLADQGLAYDSSVYPIARRRYGIPDAPLRPHRVPVAGGRSVVEFPLTALQLGPWRLPAASGAYLRLLPPAVHHAALRQCEKRGAPGIVNVHPWELDPGQPRIAAPAASRFFHYTGLGRTSAVLESLFREFRFAPLRDALGAVA
jgi:polysaccharide deacetylase family protein (PEP-CTERM system associated)